ncbi:hypothetical protein BIW11_13898 [Tropilaelaps mercedesae]|uniref:Monocarboxylate transporter n=1 Tax=Tropilaelaps mercedesae TaxID=418985 RepID=A0A1V9X070_9ACAR|nr:hypothetical protein BIW11_13898 [Tropilaelaps mercedesae]
MACYFATDITRLTIFCGICNGLGMGLNVPAIAVSLNMWFRDRKVTASGIIYTGAALGSFVYPIFFEFLIDNLSFLGSFLVLGAVMGHGFASALFIRMPPWINTDGSSRDPSRQVSRRSSAATPEKKIETATAADEPVQPAVIYPPPEPVLRRKSLMPRSVSQHSFDSVESREEAVDHKTLHKSLRPIVHRGHIVESVQEEIDGEEATQTRTQREDDKQQVKQEDDKTKDATAPTERAASPAHLQDLDCCTQHDDHCPAKTIRRPDIARVLGSVANASGSNATAGPGPRNSSPGSSIRSGHMYKLRRTSSAISTTTSLYAPAVAVSQTAERDFELKIPGVKFAEPEPARVSRLIILVSVTYVIFINCNQAFQMVLLDFSADKDVEVHEAVYLLSSFAVFDIAGRLLVGLISDAGLMTRPALVGSACVLFGIISPLLPLASGFMLLLIYSALIGLSLGTSLVLITVLVGDYVANITQIPLAIGWMAFFSGITGFTRPLLIGFFRDTMGSYDGLFHLMGVLMLTCGVSWILVSIYENRCQPKQAEKGTTDAPCLLTENTTKPTKMASDQTIEELETVTKL